MLLSSLIHFSGKLVQQLGKGVGGIITGAGFALGEHAVGNILSDDKKSSSDGKTVSSGDSSTNSNPAPSGDSGSSQK